MLELVRRLRETSATPIIFYTYYNLLFANGVEAYVRTAKDAGVDGILTLDLPPEEAGEVTAACRTHGMDTVFIVAPTTPDARIPIITGVTTGFIYYVSREGVTGVRDQVAGNITEAVARIRRHTLLPVAVGFGIGSREQVAQVAAVADGVVVGSALVNVIRDNLADRSKIAAELGAKAVDLCDWRRAQTRLRLLGGSGRIVFLPVMPFFEDELKRLGSRSRLSGQGRDHTSRAETFTAL